VSYLVLSRSQRRLVYRAGRRLRVLKAGKTDENWRRKRRQEERVDRLGRQGVR